MAPASLAVLAPRSRISLRLIRGYAYFLADRGREDMKKAIWIGFLLGSLGVVSMPRARAAEIHVFSSTALKGVLADLGPQFEKSTGNTLVLTFGPSGAIKTKVDEGTAFDVVVVTPPLLKALAASGKVEASSQAVIARSGLGVSVPQGVPKPDVATPDALKRTLLDAKSIGFNGGGASRAAIEAMFAKLGIAEALKPKITLLTVSAPEAVAKHEVELALSPISEIIAVPAAQLAGAVPAEDQSYLVLSGAVSAASKAPAQSKALLKFLTAPSALPALKANGMEPGTTD